MGYDKYGLDWSVYGSQKPQKENSSNPMQDSIGKGWSQNNNKKNTSCDEDGSQNTTDTAPKAANSVRITSAKFIPDDKTDFLKECKIQIEAQGDPATADVALWGAFNGSDYDLRLSKKIEFNGGAAESTLPLEYVDEFYDEYHGNGNHNAVVDYFFNVLYNGAVKKKSELLRLPTKQLTEQISADDEEDRWIIFEETGETIDPDFPYEMSNAQPPKNRWIYVFGSEDGSTFSRLWEIRTDSSGKKYATVTMTEADYDSRPQQEQWEDVAFLPAKASSGAHMKFLACVSDVRLPKERIFDKTNGLLANPGKRCSDIDGSKQATKKIIDNGEEKIVILNPLLHAELLRRRFDERYPQWQKIRQASWLENDDSKKKEKLVYEFGSLIIRIIEAYPDYRKHLANGQYPKLYDTVKAHEQRKIDITTDILNRVDTLCRFIGSEIFSETCRDYTCLIRKGSEQSKEYYTFEDRVGEIVEDITRFPQGAEIIKNLVKAVKTQAEHSWLQDILLLKNDVWSVTGSSGISDSHPKINGEKVFQNYRKLGDGAIKLLLEGAKSGASVYKPQELAGILEKVFATTGESVTAGLAKVPMSPEGIRPFQKVLGSFDKNSFWRIELKGNYENMFTKGPVKTGIDKLLLGLEGLALLYSVKDHLEKNSQGKAGLLDHANITVKLITYFVKSEMIKVPYKGELVKIGKGPIAVANAISSSIDTWLTIRQLSKDYGEHDSDAALFNTIAAAGYFTSTLGYTAIVATFMAGAAASSSTGIGIAPGLLLAFMGSVIAIGGKILAADADNTPLENMLLKTPWGTHPEMPASNVSSAGLQKQYIGVMRLINSFKVSIDHDTMIATLHLRRLEPTTVITIHEVTFGIPTRADGSSSTSQVVGTSIKLNDNNCEVIRNDANGTIDVLINLFKICNGVAPFLQQWKSYYYSIGKEPKPDYIKLMVTVDLDGDGIMVLPDERKKLYAEKYYDQKVKTIVA